MDENRNEMDKMENTNHASNSSNASNTSNAGNTSNSNNDTTQDYCPFWCSRCREYIRMIMELCISESLCRLSQYLSCLCSVPDAYWKAPRPVL